MPEKTPFPRICIALGIADPKALLAHARRETDGGESFLEFRLDYLESPEQGLAVIRDMLIQAPGTMILATCRRHQNHGRFNGSVEDQLRILQAAVKAGAQAVDVEIESAEVAAEHLTDLRQDTRLVVSYHNFEATPAVDAAYRRPQAEEEAILYQLMALTPPSRLEVEAGASRYERAWVRVLMKCVNWDLPPITTMQRLMRKNQLSSFRS